MLIWAEFSRAQEDDTITVTTTAEDDDNTGVDEKEEASSPAVSDNARIARDAEVRIKKNRHVKNEIQILNSNNISEIDKNLENLLLIDNNDDYFIISAWSAGTRR